MSIFGDLPMPENSSMTKYPNFQMEEATATEAQNPWCHFGRERIDSEDIVCPQLATPRKRKPMMLEVDSNSQHIECTNRRRKTSVQSVEEQNFLVEFKVG